MTRFLVGTLIVANIVTVGGLGFLNAEIRRLEKQQAAIQKQQEESSRLMLNVFNHFDFEIKCIKDEKCAKK